MTKRTIEVPDIGGAEDVEVIEVCVSVGDDVEVEDSLIVLESDKASMEVPAPAAGKIVGIKLSEGDKVSQGDAILELETEEAGGEEQEAEAEPEAEKKQQAAEKPAAAEKKPAESKQKAAGKPQRETVNVPDIGGAENVDVIEISVAEGDEIEEGDSMIVLESDKASMEVPAPKGGKVLSIKVKEGDKVSEGDAILELEAAPAAAGEEPEPEAAPSDTEEPPKEDKPAPKKTSGKPTREQIKVPDIGGAEKVDVIEVSVAEGDEIAEGDSMIVLESDKASMEVPAPKGGKVLSISVKEGDKVSEGDAILELEVAPEAQAEPEAPAEAPKKETQQPAAAAQPARREAKEAAAAPPSSGAQVYAGPAVRKMARELGVNLEKVKGTGPRDRIVKEDVQEYVKSALSGKATTGAGIPAVPEIDFSQFGEVEVKPMSRLHQITAENMHRSWLNVPHVTQFDDADITELEDFRASLKKEAEARGVRVTPLAFILKAAAAALKAHQSFNASLGADGESIVYKKYVHIGVAVDTPAGLMVPVIRDVDKKSVWELSAETAELAQKAKDRKLKPQEMQGGCFTISSLGPIGGTGFTPIVNTPEVAILAVSKLAVKPVWNGKEFEPRKMLPLSLSYDHRAVNGADAGRFLTDLVGLLADIRRLVL